MIKFLNEIKINPPKRPFIYHKDISYWYLEIYDAEDFEDFLKQNVDEEEPIEDQFHPDNLELIKSTFGMDFKVLSFERGAEIEEPMDISQYRKLIMVDMDGDDQMIILYN